MSECERCHKVKPDVVFVANPYDADINNDPTVMEWLCNECYGEYCADI